MHGPNGVDYANECVFRETGAGRIVIEHVVDPWFTLTVTLEAAGGGGECSLIDVVHGP